MRGHLQCRDTLAGNEGCPLKTGTTVYRCLLLTRMYCCVGDSLRSDRNNCGKEMILDIMANIE